MNPNIAVQPQKNRPNNLVDFNSLPTDLSSDSEFGTFDTLSLKAVFTGTVVTLLAFAALLSLGMAFGGANLQGVIQGPDTLRGLGVGTAIWSILSLAASLYIGAMIAARSRSHEDMRSGAIQGLTIAGVVLLFVLAQLGAGVVAIGGAAGKVVGAAGVAGAAAAQNPRAQQIAEDAFGARSLKSPPAEVAQGIATRLVRGDTESATMYYASQAGITQNEAQTQINEINQKVTQAANDAGIAAARALKFAGWFLFGMIVFGTAGGYLGGRGGFRKNDGYDDNLVRH